MEIAELINHQTQWEADRGIKNGNWGADRIQTELDEAKEETDLGKRLVEYADVIIIATGSVGTLLHELNMTAEDFEQLLEIKLAVNEAKYPVENFEGRTVEEAIAYSRETWNYLNFQWD